MLTSRACRIDMRLYTDMMTFNKIIYCRTTYIRDMKYGDTNVRNFMNTF